MEKKNSLLECGPGNINRADEISAKIKTHFLESIFAYRRVNGFLDTSVAEESRLCVCVCASHKSLRFRARAALPFSLTVN